MVNEKTYVCIRIILLMLICFLITGCGKQTVSTDTQQLEDESSVMTESDVRVDEETGIKIVETIEDVPVLATAHGYDMVSDGQYIYFAQHSYKRGFTSSGEKDGLYRTSLSLDNTEYIDRDYCMGLNLSGNEIYYFHEGDISEGEVGIYLADTKNLWSERLFFKDAKWQSLFLLDNEIAYLGYNRQYNNTLIFVDIEDEENTREVDIGMNEIMEANVTNGIVYFVLRNNENGHQKICVLNTGTLEYKELDDTWQDIMAVKDGCVYYVGAPQGADYEEKSDWDTTTPKGDRRNREYILKKADANGNIEETSVSGKIGDRLIAYGDYIVYTKYTNDVPDEGGDSLHGRPCLYNTVTDEEWMIDRKEFAGKEIRLRDVSAGYLYLDEYSKITYDEEGYDLSLFDHSIFCNISDSDKSILASESVVDTGELNSKREQWNQEEEEAKAEEERREQDEIMNTPYGPGTSSLILSSKDDKSTCYKLVKTDDEVEFQVLLSPGESVTKSFPCGYYVLRVAEGDTWISDEEAFGDGGSYSRTDLFYFEEGSSYRISTGTTGDFYNTGQNDF